MIYSNSQTKCTQDHKKYNNPYKNISQNLSSKINHLDQSFQSNIPLQNYKQLNDMQNSRELEDISFDKFMNDNQIRKQQANNNGKINQFINFFYQSPFNSNEIFDEEQQSKLHERSLKLQTILKQDQALNKQQNQSKSFNNYWKNQFDENMFKMFNDKKYYQKHVDYVKKQKKKSQQQYTTFFNETMKSQEQPFIKKQSVQQFISLDKQNNIYTYNKQFQFLQQQPKSKSNNFKKKLNHPTFDLFIDETDKPLNNNFEYNSHQAMEFIQQDMKNPFQMIKGQERFKTGKQVKSKKQLQLQTIKQETPALLDQSIQQTKYKKVKEEYDKMRSQFNNIINDYKKNQYDQENTIQNRLKKIDQEVRRKTLQNQNKRQKSQNAYETKKAQTSISQLKSLILKIKQQNRNVLYNNFNNQIQDLQQQLKKATLPLTYNDYHIKPFELSERKNYSPSKKNLELNNNNMYKSQSNLLLKNEEKQINFLQFKQQMLENKNNFKIKQHENYVLNNKPKFEFKKKQIMSPFEVRILSPKGNFKTTNQQIYFNNNINNKLPYFPNNNSYNFDEDILNTQEESAVFVNSQIKILALFDRTKQQSKPILAKIQIQNKCMFQLENLFSIVYGPGGIYIQVQPKRVFFNSVKEKQKCQFLVILNTQSINCKQFHVQVSYTRSGVKKKVNTKIHIPTRYLVGSLNIDEVTFLQSWSKIQKQTYLPMRKLQIPQTQWRNRLLSLFNINQLSKSDPKFLYQQMASFKYAEFPSIFFLRIQYAIGSKVGIRMKIAPKSSKQLLQQVMDLINFMYEN